MRISDWSSDVCSSDLLGGYRARGTRGYGRNVGSHRDQTLRGTSPMTLKQRERIRKAWRDYRQERHVFQYLTERGPARIPALRSEENTSELQSLMRISSAVF